jgi:hypothetical protein
MLVGRTRVIKCMNMAVGRAQAAPKRGILRAKRDGLLELENRNGGIAPGQGSTRKRMH